MITVVGSGPAGVSCAWALLQRGQRVRMIDAGIEIEPDIPPRLESLRGKPRAAWQPADTAFLRSGMSGSASGIPLKLAYGSSFPYSDPLGTQETRLEGVDLRPSLARGGLSNVWGAAILPYVQSDISDWPIAAADLAPYYRAVGEFMPVSATPDALAETFPLFRDGGTALPRSRQADSFLSDLETHHAALAAAGITFGQARLAVDVAPCVRCGLCMYGCPHDLIYNSARTLRALMQNPSFEYLGGRVVERVSERSGAVRLLGRKMPSGESFDLAAERVFLACGVLPTTRVLLASLEAFDTPIELRDSQYFLLPLLRLRPAQAVEAEELHTLAQLFIEIADPAICDRTVHLQVYSYNDLVPQALGLAAHFGPLRRQLLGRLLIVQGYLHSDHSSRIRGVLRRAAAGTRLELAAIPGRDTRRILRRVAGRLRSVSLQTRAFPLTFAARLGLPGRGYHSGGSFPMSAHPVEFQSDVFGRIAGFERVHAVDATILPSIPATTITYSVMANACRIAATVPL